MKIFNFDDFYALVQKKFSLIPLVMEIPMPISADSPFRVYSKLRDQYRPHLPQSDRNFVLFESYTDEQDFGRYSFIILSSHRVIECFGTRVTEFDKKGKQKMYYSANPFQEVKKQFDAIRAVKLLGYPNFFGGIVIAMGYDSMRYFESFQQQKKQDPFHVPTAVFLFTDESIIFNPLKNKIFIVKWNMISDDIFKDKDQLYIKYKHWKKRLEILEKNLQSVMRQGDFRPIQRKKTHKPISISSNISKQRFMSMIQQAKEYIVQGDIIQTVLSRRFEAEYLSPDILYQSLRKINPSPYLFYFEYQDWILMGSSPESLVNKIGRKVSTCPIAGSRKRVNNVIADQILEHSLMSDQKELAEHLMLVDLSRNDLGKCCQYGTIQVPQFMQVKYFPYVMHIVSEVEGILKDGEDAFSVLQACFPAGTVSGAPKIRAMQIIDQLEPSSRGMYAGAIGYISYFGDMDIAITIRSMLLQNRKIFLQTGAGIVFDSVMENEDMETHIKADGVIRAIQDAYDVDLINDISFK